MWRCEGGNEETLSLVEKEKDGNLQDVNYSMKKKASGVAFLPNLIAPFSIRSSGSEFVETDLGYKLESGHIFTDLLIYSFILSLMQ